MSVAARTAALTTLAMIAFAANSVLGRLALIDNEIGAGSFALIRLLSGAAILYILITARKHAPTGSWRGGVSLLIYAGFFAYAYIALPAGTGAVILFAVVQITMLSYGISVGERPSILQWTGLTIALAALVWLVSPGIEAPDPIGAVAMAIAGIGWGVYSLLGKGAGDPTAATAGNFIRASLIALILAAPILFITREATPTPRGIALAIASGALTSGLGYAIWYTALKHLTTTRAGIAQLTVPAIAALGGVLFLAEPVTLRFALASTAILGGVALAVLTPSPHKRKG
jgi:drug/metabolite transporter (DMT)-like permease